MAIHFTINIKLIFFVAIVFVEIALREFSSQSTLLLVCSTQQHRSNKFSCQVMWLDAYRTRGNVALPALARL